MPEHKCFLFCEGQISRNTSFLIFLSYCNAMISLQIPAHLSNNWENYVLEILMAAGIVVYFLNFFAGKSKNQRIATAWLDSQKALLETNFALVGDDGAKNLEEVETPLVKESEHAFILWCSGRAGCESMQVEMRMLKRQDLVSVISNLMKPAVDQVMSFRVFKVSISLKHLHSR